MTNENSNQQNQNRINLITSLVAALSPESYHGMYDSFISKEYPRRGEWIITGPGLGPIMWRIGFVCQIRVGCGQFGSDMYLIRHSDGQLIAHENNCYMRMSEIDIAQIEYLAAYTPAQEEIENPEGYYTDPSQIPAIGFVILESNSNPSPNTPFTITIKNESGQGKQMHRFT